MNEKRSPWLILLVLWAGYAAASMTILVPMGFPKMLWMLGVLVPGLLIYAGLFIYSASKDRPLWNRLVTGLWVGVLGTIALDVIRLPGVALGVFGDMPSMFGAMILTQKPLMQFMMEMKAGTLQPDFSMMGAMVVGYLYHFLNGIGMSTVFIVLFGGLRPIAGLLYAAVFIEFLMMVSPPVVMMMGPFGIETGGPGVFIVSLLAHVAWGLVLGYAGHKFVKPKGLFWKLPVTGSAIAR